jgi:hypothetical protein
MSRPRWYRGRSRLSFELDVGSGSHRVSWTRGRLVLHDHDLESERVLRALGGEPCQCLLLLDACRDPGPAFPTRGWRRVTGPMTALPPVSATTPMGLSALVQNPQLGALPVPRRSVAHGAIRRGHLGHLIPEAMIEVLIAAWEVRRERAGRQPPRAAGPAGAEARLQAAVAPACEEAMRRARRDLRPYAGFTIECWKQAPGDDPLLQGSLDHTGGALALTLPVSWLNRVWSRGLAVVDGHFVLAVDQPAPAAELEAQVVRWERRLAGRSTPSAVTCALRRGPRGEWRLTW